MKNTLKNITTKLLHIKSKISNISEEIDDSLSYIGQIESEDTKEEHKEIIIDESIPMWERVHDEDPDVEVSPYIEVDIVNPWHNYDKNSIKCLNGTFKEEFHVLPNDLATFAGPYGDNIWLGKNIGEGYVILVGPNYTYNKNCYTVIKVKTYTSENNAYLGNI